MIEKQLCVSRKKFSLSIYCFSNINHTISQINFQNKKSEFYQNFIKFAHLYLLLELKYFMRS